MWGQNSLWIGPGTRRTQELGAPRLGALHRLLRLREGDDCSLQSGDSCNKTQRNSGISDRAKLRDT